MSNNITKIICSKIKGSIMSEDKKNIEEINAEEDLDIPEKNNKNLDELMNLIEIQNKENSEF